MECVCFYFFYQSRKLIYLILCSFLPRCNKLSFILKSLLDYTLFFLQFRKFRRIQILKNNQGHHFLVVQFQFLPCFDCPLVYEKLVIYILQTTHIRDIRRHIQDELLGNAMLCSGLLSSLQHGCEDFTRICRVNDRNHRDNKIKKLRPVFISKNVILDSIYKH